MIEIAANQEADVANIFLIIKSKAMMKQMINYNDPGNGGCCDGMTDWGCC